MKNEKRGDLGLIQFQYRVPKGMAVTGAQIAQWREDWIQGRSTPGVRVRVTDWRYGGTHAEIRAKLRRGFRCSVAGFVDHYAGPGLVMCDYDRKDVKPLMRLWAVSRMLQVKPKWVELHRTRRGWHMSVMFSERFSPIETVALQAILGSDAFRETYNLVRVRSKQAAGRRWNLLFREKIR